MSTVYHHYELNDENVVDDLEVMDDESSDDLNRTRVKVEAAEVVVENVLLLLMVAEEDDDENVQDDEMKRKVLIAMMIEARYKTGVLIIYYI